MTSFTKMVKNDMKRSIKLIFLLKLSYAHIQNYYKESSSYQTFFRKPLGKVVTFFRNKANILHENDK